MKNFSVTLFTANYYPEDTAIGLYTTQFAKHLVKNGFKVTVVTGFPYYPQWKIFDEYKNKNDFYCENDTEINIFRYKQYVPQKVTFAGRIRLMLSLLYGSMVNYRKIKACDMVFCVVPFTLSVLPAYLLSRKTKAKLWVHVQDFEFDLALETGILKNNILTQPLKKIIFSVESILLNRANIASSISYKMLAKIREKATVEDVVYFPNWVSANNITPANYVQHPYINPEKFTLLYSGNIGEKQDWQFFEQLCAQIADPDIEIVVVGDGAYLETLKAKMTSFSFVKFFPLVAYQELSDLLCSANLHFLFQKTDVVDTIMPSKLLGMMASERPSVITGNLNSEVATVLQKSEGGLFFSNATPAQVYIEIVALKNNKQLAETIGKKARKYILETFSEEAILNTITQKINDCIIQK